MAIVFMDGFDHYSGSTQITNKWDSKLVASIKTNSRTGAGCLDLGTGGYVSRLLTPTLGSCVFGFALTKATLEALSYGRIAQTFSNTTDTQVELQYSQIDKLFRFRNGSFVSSASSVNLYDLSIGYVHIECKVTFDNGTPANNTVELRVNGVTEIGGSLGVETLDTNPEATGSINEFRLRTPSSTSTDWRYDDFYLLNSTSPNNDFLGDVKITTLHVNADTIGALSDWTGSYTDVDEATMDDNTTNITSFTNGQQSLFGLDTLANMATPVKGIQITSATRKDGAGDGDIKILTSPDGTVLYKSATIVVGEDATDHVFLMQQQDVDPDTAAAWTVPNINTAEFGVEQIS